MALDTPEKFRHEALTDGEGIRLLLLQPRSSSGTSTSRTEHSVRCDIVHTRLSYYENDLVDTFTALSYVWGDPQATRTIIINDKALSITENLFAALKDLQDDTRVLPVWADAICINQNDAEEKSRQVMLMGRIYAAAYRTIIYLGPSTPGIEDLLRPLTLRGPQMDDERAMELSLKQPDPRIGNHGVVDLLQRQWFDRVWVLQELVMSRDPWIQLGRQRLRWTRVYDDLRSGSMRALPDSETSKVSDMQNLRTRYQISANLKMETEKTFLFELVVARQGRSASDARDMVFAHMGMAIAAPDTVTSQGPPLTVDYTKSCTELYINFASKLADLFGAAAVLDCVSNDRSDPASLNLPSWVPDWTKSASRKFDQEYFMKIKDEREDAMRSKKFHESRKPSQLESYCCRDPPVLALIAQHFGTILEISERLEATPRPVRPECDFERRFSAILAHQEASGSLDYFKEPRSAWDVLVEDVYHYWRQALREVILPDELQGWYKVRYYFQALTSGDYSAIRLNEHYLPTVLALLYHPKRPLKHIYKMKIAALSSGHHIFVPDCAMKGDVFIYRHSFRPRRTDVSILARPTRTTSASDKLNQTLWDVLIMNEYTRTGALKVKKPLPIEHYTLVCPIDGFRHQGPLRKPGQIFALH